MAKKKLTKKKVAKKKSAKRKKKLKLTTIVRNPKPAPKPKRVVKRNPARALRPAGTWALRVDSDSGTLWVTHCCRIGSIVTSIDLGTEEWEARNYEGRTAVERHCVALRSTFRTLNVNVVKAD